MSLKAIVCGNRYERMNLIAKAEHGCKNSFRFYIFLVLQWLWNFERIRHISQKFPINSSSISIFSSNKRNQVRHYRLQLFISILTDIFECLTVCVCVHSNLLNIFSNKCNNGIIDVIVWLVYLR